MPQNNAGTFGGYEYARRGMGSSQLIARVTHVVYGPFLEDGKTPDPDYEDLTCIGGIKYVLINTPQYNDANGAGNRLAKPAFSFIQQYPIEGEYVYLINGPGLGLNERAGDMDVYYLPPFNLWRAANHNAFPDLNAYADFVNIGTDLSYEESQQGFTGKSAAVDPSYPFENNFIEKADIKNLVPFVGDILFEGRYGQSIRFGSTSRSNRAYNTWSNTGADGDPIIIIRNGQGAQRDKNGYELTVEDINRDQSSIYLTAGQAISVDDISKNFPLTSWDVTLQATTTVVSTILTLPLANNTISAKDQDEFTDTQTGNYEDAPVLDVGQGTSVPQTAVVFETVGDIFENPIDNSYTISLRVVNDIGTIQYSTSETGPSKEAAYTIAVGRVRSKTFTDPNSGQVISVNIPTIDKLQVL